MTATAVAAESEISGPVCGDDAIIGVVIPAIEDTGECGVAEPVQIFSVSGVKLRPAPTVTCDLAESLNAWVEGEVKPALTRKGVEVESLDIAAHYVCRNRNRAAEGKLSEHALGRAIDVSALVLSDGRRLTVAQDWRTDGPFRGLLPWVHAGACGRFGTTIGPGSDQFHEDHFHYDVATRRMPYCR